MTESRTENVLRKPQALLTEPVLNGSNLSGLAADFVGAVSPHTEASPAALLSQFLVMFGNVVGRNSYIEVELTRHYPNLFCVVVGSTAKARKGSSYNLLMNGLFKPACPEWESSNVHTGLYTGRGLGFLLRDVETDAPSTSDKRFLAVEPEFASVLRVAGMPHNDLSTLLRDAWDKDKIQSITKKDAFVANGVHISIIGHITIEELQKEMRHTEAVNGFGNRFLWFFSKRSQLKPWGAELDSEFFQPFIESLRKAIEFGSRPQRIRLADDTREFWEGLYKMYAVERGGLFGAITARAEPMTLRLALIFALLDRSPVITVDHLLSATEVWRYSEATCDLLFREVTGNSLANRIFRALQLSGNGLTRTEISRDVLSGNYNKTQIEDALQTLQDTDLVKGSRTDGGNGRTVEMFFIDDFIPSP